ncbi:UNVERIFIED_ORG: hypothetical protein ABIB52_004545 [Arthrobacter sp. UYCu721]
MVIAFRSIFGLPAASGSDIWIALGWCVGILVLAYVFAMVAYRRKITYGRIGQAPFHHSPREREGSEAAGWPWQQPPAGRTNGSTDDGFARHRMPAAFQALPLRRH